MCDFSRKKNTVVDFFLKFPFPFSLFFFFIIDCALILGEKGTVQKKEKDETESKPSVSECD